MANERQIKNNPEQQTRALPKNFRQIGEPGAKKIYMEDYVYTYLSKLAQPGNLYARGAILFGNTYQTTAGPCLFISGAAACQNFEFDLEESVFTEENWSEIYQIRDKFFPQMEIVGWFLSRMGFSVELNDFVRLGSRLRGRFGVEGIRVRLIQIPAVFGADAVFVDGVIFQAGDK